MSEHDRLEAQYEAMKARQKAKTLELLAGLVREVKDIDEAYWTHRLYGLVERAEAYLGESARPLPLP